LVDEGEEFEQEAEAEAQPLEGLDTVPRSPLGRLQAKPVLLSLQPAIEGLRKAQPARAALACPRAQVSSRDGARARFIGNVQMNGRQQQHARVQVDVHRVVLHPPPRTAHPLAGGQRALEVVRVQGADDELERGEADDEALQRGARGVLPLRAVRLLLDGDGEIAHKANDGRVEGPHEQVHIPAKLVPLLLVEMVQEAPHEIVEHEVPRRVGRVWAGQYLHHLWRVVAGATAAGEMHMPCQGVRRAQDW